MAKKTPTRRVKHGDMVELKTSKGYFYAQYINDDPKFHGELVRILPGASLKPRDLSELATIEDALWCCFWPVKRAVKAGEAKFIGNADIPKRWRKMPTFKWGIQSLKTGKANEWLLWNGKPSRLLPSDLDKAPPLNAEQRNYPILEIVPTDVIISRLENDWMPEHDCYDSPRRSSHLLPQPKMARRPKKKAAEKANLLGNDAVSAFLADVAEEGMPKVRHALAYMKRTAAKEPLERDDANIVLAIAALCVARQGGALRETANMPIFEDALAKCRGPISSKMTTEITSLVEQVLHNSELRDLIDEAGELKSWTGKVQRLLRQLRSKVK